METFEMSQTKSFFLKHVSHVFVTVMERRVQLSGADHFLGTEKKLLVLLHEVQSWGRDKQLPVPPIPVSLPDSRRTSGKAHLNKQTSLGSVWVLQDKSTASPGSKVVPPC